MPTGESKVDLSEWRNTQASLAFAVCTEGTRRILTVSKILSLQFPIQGLFSMKSNWALGCTTHDRRCDGSNAVRHNRDCHIRQGPDR
jgi:hypothetical protein